MPVLLPPSATSGTRPRTVPSTHRLRRRSRIAVAVLLLVLTGCRTAAGGAAPTADGAPVLHLADATPVPDPKTYVGASTAVLDPAATPTDVPTATSQLPVTVTDNQGTRVTVRDTSRILTLDLYGTLAQTVYRLGLGGSVVGRDVSTSFPGSDELPLVTRDGHQLNGEAMLELAPTVILTDTSLGPWDAVLQMRDAGIPVVVLDPHRDLATNGALVQQVADALGVHDRGTELAAATTRAVQSTVAQIAAVAPAEPDRKLRMVFLYVRGQAGVFYMFGAGSGTDSLITALGGRDVATEIGWSGMKPVSAEGLVAAQPDLVLVMTEGLASVGGVDGLLEAVPALAETPAGQHHRVVDMADTEVLSFGPHTADVLDALATAVYAPGSRP